MSLRLIMNAIFNAL